MATVNYIKLFHPIEANLAKDLGIKILVDAEFVSCKAGISLMAHCLMARHNGSSPVIGNTTQAYLKVCS